MLGFLGTPSTPLLRDGEDGIELAERSPSRQRDVGPGGNTIVTVQGANGSVFATLPPCDFVSFLAIVQSLKVPIFEFEPDTSNSIHMGSRTHVVHLTGRKGIVFKSEPDMEETLANKVLVSEILVLRHPILSQHQNIHRLLGVALQPKFHETKFLRVLPHLVFEKSDYGSLWEFMIGNPKRSRSLSFLDRLRLCKDIGDGIVAMHSFNIVHTDIKPHNVLLFKVGKRLIAKVNDFGCTCFGAKESDPIEPRGATREWMAPEQMRFTEEGCRVGDAKRMDAYSFGKVCAWLLFWQELPGEIPDVEQKFDFDDAMDALLQTKEADSGELSDQNFRLEIIPALSSFFAASYTITGRRKTVKKLTGRLASILRCWELRYDKSQPTYVRAAGCLARDGRAVWQGLGGRFRAFLARLFSLFVSKKAKVEFSVPGELRMVVLSSKLKELGLLIASICLFAVFLVVVGLYGMAMRTPRPNLVLLILLVVMVVAFSVFLFLAVRVLWYRRSHYRTQWEAFAPFGHVAHLVPQLPELFPILNRQQYVVRDMVVKGLIKKAGGKCETCRVKAAKQLAFCCRATFGKSDQPFHTYEHWITASGKTHVDDLCREADFWEDRYSPIVDTLKSALQESSNIYILGLQESKFYLKTLPTTISRYKEEIDGKLKANVCISSAAVLQVALGGLCLEHYMYKDAEDAFRGAGEKRAGLQSLPWWRRGFQQLSGKDYQTRDMLARALTSQAKFGEAIEVVKAIPGVTHDLESKRQFWRKKSTNSHNGWRNGLSRRTLVLKWLVTIGRLDEGWESWVVKTLQSCDDDWWEDCDDCSTLIRRALSALDGFADSLVERNKLSKAAEISWQCLLLNEKYFASTNAKKSDRTSGNDAGGGDDHDEDDSDNENDNVERDVNGNRSETADVGGSSSKDAYRAQQIGGGKGRKPEARERFDTRRSRSPRVWAAAKKHASILSLGTMSQVQEALSIQRDLLDCGTFAETDEETLALLTDRAMALSRLDRHEEALEVTARVQDIKQADFGDVHLVSLGFMADLAGSLCLHDREALEAPALMQREVLSIAKDFSSKPTVQQMAVSLLWSLSRPASLHESISKLRALSKYCESQYPGQVEVVFKLRYWLVLVLLHLGATFEDLTELDEAKQLIGRAIAGGGELFDDSPAHRVDAARLNAAVHSKITKVLCDRSGFGPADFKYFDESMQAHRSALQTAVDVLGPEHPTTTDCRMRLAIVLSDVGVALNREDAISEARLFFQKMGTNPQAKYCAYTLAVTNDEEVSDEDVHSAFDKLSSWLVGDKMTRHPGDLALRVQLAELLLNNDGHHGRARRALFKAKKEFHSLRERWASSPDHHPDVLRATDAYATLQYERNRPYEEVARTRQLNWWAVQTHRKESQARTLARYKSSLALALSGYTEHQAEAVAMVEDVLRKTVLRDGQLHRSTAQYSTDLGFALKENGDRDAAISRYSESLEIYQDMFGNQHPSTHRAGGRLLRVLRADTDMPQAKGEVRHVLEDVDGRPVIESNWSKKKLETVCILLCSSMQYLGPTHPLTASYQKALEFMFETGGLDSARVEILLERIASIRFTRTEDPVA